MVVTAHPTNTAWRDLRLAGTLHLPAASSQPGPIQPVPTVLMLQGSGPSDRCSNGYFTAIREAFLDRGVATIAFDKPGCGESTGDWRHHGLRDRADQASTVLDEVVQHPAVDADQVGVFGHSQGGWLVQLLAADRDDLRFAVATSGPSITVSAQDRFAVEQTMRADGCAEIDVAAALDYLDAVHRAAAARLPYGQVEADVLAPARRASWYRYHEIGDEADWGLACRLIGDEFDPLEALRRIGCPFLAVYGGADLLVPAWRCAEESGRALVEAGNPDATVVVLPGADHRLQVPSTGQLVAGYLDLLADWAGHRAAVTTEQHGQRVPPER